jgi:DNA mismatch endonuclease (patch repair protein)
MARVSRRDTLPELELRRELHARGMRYRVDVSPDRAVRGRADILFRPARVAVYVDGCFWHSCPEHGVLPKGNREWWRAKLRATVLRDRSIEATLRGLGWTVVRVWEHEDPTVGADRVEVAVKGADAGSDPRMWGVA